MAGKYHGQSNITGCQTTRIYCLPECPPGKRTKPENRVYFESIQDARNHGYRACKVCKPDDYSFGHESFILTSCRTPLGVYAILSSKLGIVCIEPEEHAQKRIKRWKDDGIQISESESEYNKKACEELDSYFKGKLFNFNIPLDLRGTGFQRRVWNLLLDISYGETASYGDIARSLGKEKASRPVGGANSRNPVSIVVPCHRVIGSNGKLTGYGGGLERKKALLELESKVLSKQKPASLKEVRNNVI